MIADPLPPPKVSRVTLVGVPRVKVDIARVVAARTVNAPFTVVLAANVFIFEDPPLMIKLE